MLFIILLCSFLIPFSLSKYYTKINKKITIRVNQPEYNVVFNANAPSGTTATGSMENQHFVYGTADNLRANAYEVSGYLYTGWCTDANGNGDFYTDMELVDKLTQTDNGIVNLYAQWRDVIAEINGTYYKTLQAAINAVPTNNTPTVVKLLWNTSESLTIAKNKNIIFNFQNYTISNNGSTQVIINKGTISISNGTIRSSAGYAAIDNEEDGKIYVSGGRIIATGNRQSIYNSKGTVEISGDAYLCSSVPITLTDKERGTITNTKNGNVIIKGGTIVSTTSKAVYNEDGLLTVGTQDNNPNVNSLVIQGEIYGIKSTNTFKFYDGTIKGKNRAIDFSKAGVGDKETGYEVVLGRDGNYETAYLANACLVRFDPNGGTLIENTRGVISGNSIGELPIPTQSSSIDFAGWYTLANGGSQISENTIITSDVTYYAHWNAAVVAEINGTEYSSLQEAVGAVLTDNVETTITLTKNTKENITVAQGKNIVFDLQNYEITNSTTDAVISNNGTVKIINGTIKTTSERASAINNNPTGKITISGGRILAIGQRQALYNSSGGDAEITGSAYLSSSITATGERGTVHNLAGGKIKITGGTIVSTTNQAVYNLGTMTIGEEGGSVSTSSPEIQGETYGVKSTVNFGFFDGKIKGKTEAFADETKITPKETGYELKRETEEGYKKVYLGIIE